MRNRLEIIKSRLRKDRLLVHLLWHFRKILHDSDISFFFHLRQKYLKKNLLKGPMSQFLRFPRILVETSVLCNARCIICPIEKIMKSRLLSVMDMRIFQKIVNECAQYKSPMLTLNNYGDPLLDPLIVERISYAKSQGIPFVQFSTNGSELQGDLAKKLLDSGLDKINISLDASAQGIFSKIRIGLDYNKIEQNVRDFISLRNKMGLTKPFIQVSLTAIRDCYEKTCN